MKIKRPLVYIAGAYRSKWGIIGRLWNIWKAYLAARRLTAMGYACIVPHLETALMDGVQSDKFFLESGIKKLKHCDMIYLLKGWEKSQGASEEEDVAEERGLNIWYEGESKPRGYAFHPDYPLSIPPVITEPLPYKIERQEG